MSNSKFVYIWPYAISKLLIIFLIFSFCVGDYETATVEDSTKTTSSTATTYDFELAWDNFIIAWENNLKTELVLNSNEMAITEELNKLWTWQGDKNNLNQYLFEIEVNGLICSRIYNSMGWALLDEIHPIEKDYRSSHTYKCDESGSLYLFGEPFYYQNNWWIFHNIDLDLDILDCDDPCGTRAQHYASKFKIDNPETEIITSTIKDLVIWDEIITSDFQKIFADEETISFFNKYFDIVTVDKSSIYKQSYYEATSTSLEECIDYEFELLSKIYWKLSEEEVQTMADKTCLSVENIETKKIFSYPQIKMNSDVNCKNEFNDYVTNIVNSYIENTNNSSFFNRIEYEMNTEYIGADSKDDSISYASFILDIFPAGGGAYIFRDWIEINYNFLNCTPITLSDILHVPENYDEIYPAFAGYTYEVTEITLLAYLIDIEQCGYDSFLCDIRLQNYGPEKEYVSYMHNSFIFNNNQLVIDIGLDFPHRQPNYRVILWDNLKLITSKYFNEFLK